MEVYLNVIYCVADACISITLCDWIGNLSYETYLRFILTKFRTCNHIYFVPHVPLLWFERHKHSFIQIDIPHESMKEQVGIRL